MSTFHHRILNQACLVLRSKHYPSRTETSYHGWICQSIVFHKRRYLGDLGAADVAAYLTHLAIEGKVAATTQNQGLNALLLLY
jgi:hypothetical protein